MQIFAVANDPKSLEEIKTAIRKAAPDAALTGFALAGDALSAVRDGGLCPDIVFSGIEMPGMSGLVFAATLRKMLPDTAMVFVVDTPQYALDAFGVRAKNYIISPLTPQDVLTELQELQKERKDLNRLQVRCFGRFEVFWKGEPLKFARRQTKEVLAMLVDRRGEGITAEEMILMLWGDADDMDKAKHRIRNFLSDLRSTLGKIGMQNVLIRDGARVAIRPAMLDCDYYRLLEKEDRKAIREFSDEYMSSYSWAEPTRGSLQFQKKP